MKGAIRIQGNIRFIREALAGLIKHFGQGATVAEVAYEG